jgi:hypothetical protein
MDHLKIMEKGKIPFFLYFIDQTQVVITGIGCHKSVQEIKFSRQEILQNRPGIRAVDAVEMGIRLIGVLKPGRPDPHGQKAGGMDNFFRNAGTLDADNAAPVFLPGLDFGVG